MRATGSGFSACRGCLAGKIRTVVATVLLAAIMLPFPALAWDLSTIAQSLSADCWICDGVTVIGDIGLTSADAVFSAVSSGALQVAAILFALWGLALAASAFLPFRADPTLWNRGATRLLGFALLFSFLGEARMFWDYLFSPLIGLGMALTLGLQVASLSPDCGMPVLADGLAGAQAVLHAARCPLRAAQDLFVRGIVSGLAMVLGAGFSGWLDFMAVWSWPAHLIQALAGVGLSLVYLFGLVLFPFFFIDTVLRAVIVAMMAPLAALFWPFQSGRRVVGRAVEGLWLAALTLVFTAVASGLAAALIRKAFLHLDDGGGDWASLLSRLESGDLRLNIADQTYWMLLATGIVGIFMIRGARRMAASFGHASVSDFSGATSAVAVMAGWTARRAVGGADWVRAQAAVGRTGGRPTARPPLLRHVGGRAADGKDGAPPPA